MSKGQRRLFTARKRTDRTPQLICHWPRSMTDGATDGRHDLSGRPQCWRFEPRVDRAVRASAPDNFSAFAVVYVVTISADTLSALTWDLG